MCVILGDRVPWLVVWVAWRDGIDGIDGIDGRKEGIGEMERWDGRKEGREGRKEGIGERVCVALLLRESINQFCSYTYIHKYIHQETSERKQRKPSPKRNRRTPAFSAYLQLSHISSSSV